MNENGYQITMGNFRKNIPFGLVEITKYICEEMVNSNSKTCDAEELN
jgi:hypothetical protein